MARVERTVLYFFFAIQCSLRPTIDTQFHYSSRQTFPACEQASKYWALGWVVEIWEGKWVKYTNSAIFSFWALVSIYFFGTLVKRGNQHDFNLQEYVILSISMNSWLLSYTWALIISYTWFLAMLNHWSPAMLTHKDNTCKTKWTHIHIPCSDTECVTYYSILF